MRYSELPTWARELLSPGIYLLGENIMAARHHRNAAVRVERFLQYRQLLLRGPSALSFSTR